MATIMMIETAVAGAAYAAADEDYYYADMIFKDDDGEVCEFRKY